MKFVAELGVSKSFEFALLYRLPKHCRFSLKTEDGDAQASYWQNQGIRGYICRIPEKEIARVGTQKNERYG